MHHRFMKLSFILAASLVLSSLALNAQATAPRWTGVHVGVIGGSASGNYNLHLTDGTDTADFDSSYAGGRVGVQGGVDVDFHGLVLGAMADWSRSNASFKINESTSSSGGGFNEEIRSTAKQITTVRGRVGHSHGRVLPYVHGGLLVADTEFKETSGSTSIVPLSGTHTGFVVGAGFEYLLAHHYTLTTEYGYNHLGSIVVPDSVIGGGGSGVTASENPHFHTVTVGFNYRF